MHKLTIRVGIVVSVDVFNVVMNPLRLELASTFLLGLSIGGNYSYFKMELCISTPSIFLPPVAPNKVIITSVPN